MTTTMVRQMIDDKITGKKVMVFSKTTCPYCSMAKKVLKEYNLTKEDFEVMEIDRHQAANKIQDYLKKKTGARTVPRVFINGKCIGGGDATFDMHKNGKLRKMLEHSK
ncbi:hypothetical protein FSP39_021170 [Pinctada imbricata]|uniref:Glutaredoxin domain-containing protein n=1 Tax=Pinctada imbricata TaxID=66713 RepID=A0AA88YB54_PINIB|nr:hypothetical protein FSP39_021170 [Pinctada imbricata]